MQEVLTGTLTNIVLAFISLGGAYALYFINKCTQHLRAKAKSDEMNIALDRVDKLAEVTVKSIEQTTAKELRQLVKDGSVSKDKLEALANKAFADIMQSLEPEYLNMLEQNMGSIETYISNLIEQKVLELKGKVT